MKHRGFLPIGLAATGLLPAFTASGQAAGETTTPSAAAEAQKPNILFIMTDQQRYDGLAINGNKILQTPHLDKLAQSGVNLQRYFVNSPVCIPSRGALFTGRYPHCLNMEYNSYLSAGNEITLFRVAKQNGYNLGYSGKNHVLEKCETVNFSMWRTIESDLPENVQTLRDSFNKNFQKKYGKSYVWKGGISYEGPVEDTQCWQTAEWAIEFLKKQKTAKEKKPFMLTVSFLEPHVPHVALKEDVDKYPLDQIKLYPFGGEEELNKKPLRWRQKYAAHDAVSATDEDKKRYIAIYYAMITGVDRQIGRILEELEKQGYGKNTIIVFTTDHGEFAFEHGYAKKDIVLIDSLLHVPCIINYPEKLQPRTVADTMVEQVDLMPTILDLAGMKTPMGVQGISLMPYLEGKTDCHKNATIAGVVNVFQYNQYKDVESFLADNGGRGNTPYNVPGDYVKGIREQNWRYTWFGNGEEELYDHTKDPHELNNVASEPAYAVEKARLKLRLFETLVHLEEPLTQNGRRLLQAEYSNWEPKLVHDAGFWRFEHVMFPDWERNAPARANLLK